MVNVPTIAALETAIVLSESYELMVSSASPGVTANDKLLSMTKLRLSKKHPEVRTNYGKIKTYNYGSPDIGLHFSAKITEELVNYLRDRDTRTAAGILPIYTWAIKLTSAGGVSRTITMKGSLFQKEYIKSDDEQAVPSMAECVVRIRDDEPVAT